jgi:mannitol/fructose-specific phosphotransferase system IIA component (Ntr-type)
MSTMAVPPVLTSSLFVPDLKSKRKEAILHELVEIARRARAVRDPELLREALLKRERWCGSALGKGVAIPHARSIGIVDPRLVVGRSRRGIDWDAPDGLPVQIVVLALSPSESSEEAHHELLARAVAMTRLVRNRQKLLDAVSPDAVASLLREFGP